MTDTLDIEIFATGIWGGQAWTVDDLDAMVRNFGKVSHVIKPPVKLGHTDAQIIAGQKDGQPALGWVSGLRRMGQKLIATVRDMPALLQDLIRRRRYDRVSAEIYPKAELCTWEANTKTGVTGPVLSGFALLGAEVPEVKTLEDLHRVLACELHFAAPADGAVRITAVADDPVPMRGARHDESRKESSQVETLSFAEAQRRLDARMQWLEKNPTILHPDFRPGDRAAYDQRLVEDPEVAALWKALNPTRRSRATAPPLEARFSAEAARRVSAAAPVLLSEVERVLSRYAPKNRKNERCRRSLAEDLSRTLGLAVTEADLDEIAAIGAEDR